MATRYVGIGGNDGNSGLTWALRKLTLNGVEDTPVVAGDLIYVGPGAYRETLTVDVSGGAGTEIVCVGDETGEHTDSVGGVVRLTGSDNDQTRTRNYCISGGNKDYRTFRGFQTDMAALRSIHTDGAATNWIVEDCTFQSTGYGIYSLNGSTAMDWIVRRCKFIATAGGILFHSSIATDNVGTLIENCLFAAIKETSIGIQRGGDGAIRNCTFVGSGDYHISFSVSGNAGHEWDVNNCILQASDGTAMQAATLGDLVENFNTFSGNQTDRTNVAVGANSETYPALLSLPILHSGVSQISGFKFPWQFGELSQWSQIQAITGSNEPTEDFHGILRPVTAAKNSWGSHQFMDMERETGTTHAGSASMVLHDAGRHQIWVPVANESTTISVYVYREANYAGNNPQMIVKQPGQADDITTDAAAASQWNLLTTTLTPAADPPYVVVELVSQNTAAALAYETFFDDLVVS